MKLYLNQDLFDMENKVLATAYDDANLKADIFFMIPLNQLKQRFECYGCVYDSIIDANFVVSKNGLFIYCCIISNFCR